MTKLLATLVFLTITNLLNAQNGYVKYHIDSEYQNKSIKVLKGEILPFFRSEKENLINIVIGNDTIFDLHNESKSFEIVKSVNTTYNSKKEYFLQIKKGGVIWVNATAIQNTDTVTLFSESGKQLTQLIDKREAQVNQSDLGKICRLLITNCPTIFYSTDKLKEFVEPELTPLETQTEVVTETKDEGWAWWFYFLIVLGIGGIGFGIWKFIKSRKPKIPTDKEPVYALYRNNKSLSDFAREQGTNLDTLLELNSGVIDKMYLRYSESDRKEVQKNLNNKKLIVHYQKKAKSWPVETIANIGDLSNQLRQMEENIKSEIRNYGSGNNHSNELNNLKREFTELRNEKNKIESEKQNLVNSINQLQRDKAISETNLQNANDEKTKVQGELNELQKRVIELDFMKGYAESVFNYFDFCQKVSSDAYNYFQKVNQQNPKQAYAAGHLLMKFQVNINSLPIGNWIQIVQDIKDTGATTNRQLTRSFSQIQSNAERKKAFQRLLFSNVLVKYSSNILILAEAFKNISRLQGTTDFTNEAQNTFGKHITEIVNRAKSTELELKHVSLFENWERYMGQVEDNGSERSLAYKDVEGLAKGSIAEIISIGVKTFDEDTKTMVIIN